MEDSKPDKVVPSKVIGFKAKPSTYTLSPRNAMLYAYSLNYSSDPLSTPDLSFTYELSDPFRVLPTMGTVFYPLELAFAALRDCPGMPDFNPMMLLHGEEKVIAHSPFQIDKEYIVETELADVQDKVKGALVVVKMLIKEKSKEQTLAMELYCTLFIRGIGGFDSQKSKQKVYVKIPKIPKTKGEGELEQKTTPGQAIVYRLNGDYNPLHVDPDMAAMGGFKRPILHGLCSYGVTAKLLVRELLEDEVERFVSFSARFTSHVFPGETLVVRYWRTGLGKVTFATATKERGKVVAVGEMVYKDKSPKL